MAGPRLFSSTARMSVSPNSYYWLEGEKDILDIWRFWHLRHKKMVLTVLPTDNSHFWHFKETAINNTRQVSWILPFGQGGREETWFLLFFFPSHGYCLFYFTYLPLHPVLISEYIQSCTSQNQTFNENKIRLQHHPITKINTVLWADFQLLRRIVR